VKKHKNLEAVYGDNTEQIRKLEGYLDEIRDDEIQHRHRINREGGRYQLELGQEDDSTYPVWVKQRWDNEGFFKLNLGESGSIMVKFPSDNTDVNEESILVGDHNPWYMRINPDGEVRFNIPGAEAPFIPLADDAIDQWSNNWAEKVYDALCGADLVFLGP